MTNIHVPIDSSNITSLIPEGEDILYSTMCKVTLRLATGGKAAKWNSHVLVSQSGFASQTRLEPYVTKKGKNRLKIRKKKEPLLPTFTEWKTMKGQGLKQIPFTKQKILIVLNPMQFIHYKDTLNTGLGEFCRNLWHEANAS